ncbi:uncharacterized protein LOC111260099 [Varroa jacobsoni]|uniref:uncharacterized protein LOC111260099 n=1 Tax=Varroa jacobsoni TaxID=62625 RepID=UPI000BF7214F|nr:uncharacterized protein LOC111260099 [Varroa jacobsoni]
MCSDSMDVRQVETIACAKPIPENTGSQSRRTTKDSLSSIQRTIQWPSDVYTSKPTVVSHGSCRASNEERNEGQKERTWEQLDRESRLETRSPDHRLISEAFVLLSLAGQGRLHPPLSPSKKSLEQLLS